jgi:SAM-dependent methyltransferase
MQEVGYYDDPERYDAEYAFLAADCDWYARRASELGDPALVLGCGSGRVLFQLAARGLKVDGLDSSPVMLDAARSRAVLMRKEMTERSAFYQGDMRAFSLPFRYRSVSIPLNGLMHLVTDDEMLACLFCVREHLAEGGRLFFDVSNPRGELLEAYGAADGMPIREFRLRGVTYLQSERHRYDPPSRISETVFSYEPQDADSPRFRCRLRLRMYPPAEIERLLSLSGFEIVERLGTFSGETFDGSGLTQIVVAGFGDSLTGRSGAGPRS